MAGIEIRHDILDCGEMREVSFYPCINGKRISDTEKKTSKTKEQMDEENFRKEQRKFIRRANENFSANDFIITCEYDPRYAPNSEEEFHEDFYNYIRRIKYARKKKGLGNKNFKYNIATTFEFYKSGAKKGLPHFHFHGFITADGMTAEELRALWRYGTKGQIERFDPYTYGPVAFAKYAAQQAKGKRRFLHSKNCTLPVVKKNNEKKHSRISKKKLAELAEQYSDDHTYWEKRYPSYRFYGMDKRFNETNGYYYVTVYLYKKPKKDSYYERSRRQARPNLAYAHLKR